MLANHTVDLNNHFITLYCFQTFNGGHIKGRNVTCFGAHASLTSCSCFRAVAVAR